MPQEKNFLGRGMKFPPQINPATGRFMTSEGPESIKESIYLILMTQQSERPLRPTFGSDIMSYTSIDLNAGRLNMISRSVRDQIMTQEPRVTDVRINMEDGEGSGIILFNIDYTIISTNTRDNLVFPFYLNAAPVNMQEGEPEIYEPEEIEEITN